MKYENIRAELLEVQLVIGKAVVESMLELIPKKGTEKAIVPVTLEDENVDKVVISKGE